MPSAFSRIAAFLTLTLLVRTTAAWAQEPEGAHFTAAQAEHGRDVYSSECASCHGGALDDGVAPPLAGDEFVLSWGRAGRTLDDLFFITRTTMPEGEGGTLSEEQYLDVLAYMLLRNGYSAGERELTADATELTAVTLESQDDAAPTTRSTTAFIRGSRGLVPEATGPTQDDLNAAGGNSDDWLYHTHDYSGRRYSELTDINADNVGQLAPVCMYAMGGAGSFQSGPIVRDGVMYVTTLRSTVALDAATCQVQWRHEWEPQALQIPINNRGVAIKDGRVVRATPDGYLLALDAANGEFLWARQVAQTMQGETFSMPPLIYDDLIVIGPAVSEFAIEGWVAAFKLENGEKVWHFNTVPGAKDGTGTWPNPENIVLGGGGVWTPLSLDPETEELYVAVTNPAPDLPAHLRPGLNLYTNSVVALDIRSGELRWYDQVVPNDFYDWDLTQVSPLFKTTIEGRERDLLATVGKDGFLRVLDRESHERLYETPISRQLNADVPLTKEGVRVCPGVNGGVLWHGPAYNPGTNQLYIGAIDWCTTFALTDSVRFVPGQLYMGGTFRPDPENEGRVTAVDASTGEVRWMYRSELPVLGAVTTTAGNLLFLGELTGDLVAFNAETGDELFRSRTSGPIGGGVVTYTVDGKQYVAVSSGRPSGLNWRAGPSGAPNVMIFALPG